MLKIKPSTRKTFSLSDLEPVSVISRYPYPPGDIDDQFAIKFEVTENQNIFFSLDNLEQDLDIYLSLAIGFSAHGTPIVFPYSNSTNHGNEAETIFAQLPEGEYFLVIRDSFLVGENTADYAGTLKFNSKVFDNKIATLPNDPLLGNQWHLFNKGIYSTYDSNDFVPNQESNGILPNADIRAPEAWREIYSASDVVVAVVDSGIEIRHPDLRENIWTNTKEIPGNDFDDDDNGYDDDVYGWNFGNNSNDPTPSVPSSSHGTHVAGTIGASGNNGIGVTGVAWDVQIMPISIEDPLTKGLVNSDKALRYASKNGADIVNMSFGNNFKLNPAEGMIYMRANGTPVSEAPEYIRLYLKDVAKPFKQAKKSDMLMVIAAGNDGDRINALAKWEQIGNLDQTFSSYNFMAGFYDNAITIASSDGMNQLSPYTNTGISVDLSAPGGNTTSGPEYAVLSTMPIGHADDALSRIRDKAEGLGFDRNDVGTWNIDLQNEWMYSLRENLLQAGSDYGYMQGTSMAAPVVSGAAALVKAVNQDFTANDIRQILLKSATQNNRLKGLAGQNGLMLNLEAAVKFAGIWRGKESFYELQKGNKDDNELSSTPTNAWLRGMAGNDSLRGNKGDDLICGGDGDDLLIPGEGLDQLKGGSGRDVIRYYHQDESPIARPDRIFMSVEDQIDLSALDGNPRKPGVQKLKFITTSDFSGKSGQLMAKSNGFFVDLDGDSFADFGALFAKEIDFQINQSQFIL